MSEARATDQTAWYGLTAEETLQKLGVDPARGLDDAEVVRRREQYGPNRLAEEKPEPGWQAFLRQYQDLMQIVLVVVALISIVVLQDFATGIFVFGLTVLNAVMGLNQEGKAAESVAALRKMLIIKAKARRNGELVEIPAEELVPGDIVTFEAGDKVSADGRLLTAAALDIEEAGLTGESAPVTKDTTPIEGDDVPLGDRLDMAYMNSTVTRGRGEMVVTGTGMNTEVGQISNMLTQVEDEKSPLTKQLDQLTVIITAAAGVALILVIALGLARGQDFDSLFLMGISLAISAIPTGLPAVVTTLLSIGTQQLAEKGAIIKRLKSVETLGATSAICSDKTGTLTLNQMTARELVLAGRRYSVDGEGYSTEGRILRVAGEGDPQFEPILMPMALCSDATVTDGQIVGDPTEAALVVLAAKGGIDVSDTRKAYPRVAEVPFDSAYKYMATFHRMQPDGGKPVIRAYVKGAPDVVLGLSTTGLNAQGSPEPIESHQQRALEENDRLASEGLRVLAVAYRDFDPDSFNPSGDLLGQVKDLTLVAFVGIVDPPRKEAKDAIALCKDAGIRVRMITGDHATTAAAIARQLGITGRAVTGSEFAAMSDAEVDRQIEDIGVIARVAPEDKVRLVDVLKRRGNIVAMTGDGVNDAPAIKRSDIGVAMGITGTEVTKEAAEMILTDDNFATIVTAVDGGRVLYDNLMKYVRFQVVGLTSFILLFVLAGLFNIADGIPLEPLQILWINFSVQVLLAIGLGFDAPTPGIMERKPRPANAPILTRAVGARLVALGLIGAVTTLVVIAYGEDTYESAVALTMGLVTLSLINVIAALEERNPERSVFDRTTVANRRFNLTILGCLGLTVLVTELGFLQRIFNTTSLSAEQWGVCLLASLVVIVLAEIVKFVSRQTGQASTAPVMAEPALQPAPSQGV
ncbi:MAG: ATPase [Thermomicrobiales bacterium]|jgi:Ca2+-transporting ATPase|nr:ATPase [Thermomicrobiales bacterium]MDF3039729.1 ATPase [Thermomicrobiales bacterium]